MAPDRPRRLAYFPGCMSLDCAREMDISLRAVFAALDIHLVELPDWNCCGGNLVDSMGSGTAWSLAERILRRTGVDITLCPHCGKGHLRRTDRVIMPSRSAAGRLLHRGQSP